MKILHLHVKKEYYEQARIGNKNEEYRIIKPYWTKRLINRKYNFIYYYDGYTKRILKYKYAGYRKITILHKEFGNKPVKVYAICLRHLI